MSHVSPASLPRCFLIPNGQTKHLFIYLHSGSGLLHKVMEPEGRPPSEDHPITPPSRKRPDSQRRLLLQSGRMQRASRPAHGCQTRPVLLPIQHRLPGWRRAAGWMLGKNWKCLLSQTICNIFAKCANDVTFIQVLYDFKGFGWIKVRRDYLTQQPVCS